MSTRSAIGILNDDGSVTAVYCHWDGYPSYVGKMLINHYKSLTRIKNLLKHGNLSFIAPHLGRKHDFNNASKHHPDWCLFYGRDRGESDQQAKTFGTTEAFENHYDWSDYYYLYNNGHWLYKRRSAKIYEQLTESVVREVA